MNLKKKKKKKNTVWDRSLFKYTRISSTLCKVCVYEKCLFHSKRPKKITICIFLRDITQQWYYTQGEIVTYSFNHRHNNSDTASKTIQDEDHRSKATEKSQTKKKKEKRYKKKFKKSSNFYPKFFDNDIRGKKRKLHIED